MTTRENSLFPVFAAPENGDLVTFYVDDRERMEIGRFSVIDETSYKIERVSSSHGGLPVLFRKTTKALNIEQGDSYTKCGVPFDLFTYKFLDEEMNDVCHALPVSTIRDLLNLEVVENVELNNNKTDAFGNRIQPGDLVVYVERDYPLSIGRVESFHYNHVWVKEIANHEYVSLSPIASRKVCVIPNTDANKEVIRNMTYEDILDFYVTNDKMSAR
jgi:hypothetical protein